jgi:ketosteroid isomerase-like protein
VSNSASPAILGPVSEDNVQVVRSILAKWAKGDYSSIDWADPDIVFRGGDGVESQGLEVLTHRWREFLEAWDHFATSPERFIDLGDDHVLVLVRFEGRGRASGAPTTAFSGGQLFTLRAGKVLRLDLYTSFGEALEAAGLAT